MPESVTERLYYTDSALMSFDAAVLDAGADRRHVLLDRSAFYPASGGQPHDTGTIAGCPVTDVTEEGDTVVHHLAAPLPPDTQIVSCTVDWPRRFDHMQQHSGQHLLSAVLEDRFGWPTVSVHIGSETCSVDLAAETVSADALRDAERLVNAHVTEDRDVTITFEDARAATGLRKPSDRDGLLRIVTIAGLDRNACGGTHVARTGAIGPVLLRRTERTRGTTRVEFRCGARAVARARRDAELLQQMAALFSASVDDLAPLVTTLHADHRALDKERVRLHEQLVAYEMRALYDATAPDAQGRRTHVVITDAPVKSLQPAAQQYVKGGNAVYLAVSTGAPAVLLAASDDSAIDCGRMLRDALGVVGGRGGGTTRLAQGSAPSAEAALACRDRVVDAIAGA